VYTYVEGSVGPVNEAGQEVERGQREDQHHPCPAWCACAYNINQPCMCSWFYLLLVVEYVVVITVHVIILKVVIID